METTWAAVVTVGSELTAGARIDTNTAEIARELRRRGFDVREAVSVGDDVDALCETFRRLTTLYGIVITTGGLGPTHDDVTRQAAAAALGVTLTRDPRLRSLLEPISKRHTTPQAIDGTFLQADVLPGAGILDPTTGTAPGQMMRVGESLLILLPGPPSEMRAMLSEALAHHPPTMVAQAEIGVVGLTESDAQAIVAHALAELHTGIGFTILARPGDVRILLDVTGHPPNDLDIAVEEVAKALHPHCYTTSGESLPEAVVSAARRGGLSIACAESCTGGLIAAALTDVPGCSDVFAGAAVTYSNESKAALTEVDPTTIATYGAVSTETAAEMARGVRQRLDVDIAVAVSGIAGPGGGTAEKPVGTVCFALADAHGIATERRLFLHGSRQSIRERSTSHALDLLRRSALRS